MIKIRNQEELVLNLTIEGQQTSTTTGAGFQNAIIVPWTGVIKAIWAKLSDAGTTNTQTTDILKNGVSIAASGTVLSFATTAQDPTYAAFTAAPVTVARGDILKATNTAVHTTPAKNCVIYVVIQKARAGDPVSATQTGTLGLDELL